MGEKGAKREEVGTCFKALSRRLGRIWIRR